MSPPENMTISGDAAQALCRALAQELMTVRLMLTEERMQRTALQQRLAELEAERKPKTIAQALKDAEREAKTAANGVTSHA